MAHQESACSEYSRGEVLDAVRPYIKLNRAEFEAELVSLVTKSEANLTRNEKFIRKHQNSMRNVRNAMVELELANLFLD